MKSLLGCDRIQCFIHATIIDFPVPTPAAIAENTGIVSAIEPVDLKERIKDVLITVGGDYGI